MVEEGLVELALRTKRLRDSFVRPSMSPVGTYRAASPQTSRATGVSARTMGTPHASASSGGSPEPSYSDANANTRASR